jgi:hypothetical protein
VTSVASRANSMRKIFVEATFAGFSLVSGLGGSIPCGEQNLGSHKGKRQELGSQVDFCIGGQVKQPEHRHRPQSKMRGQMNH